MRLNNHINKFPTYLSDSLKEILDTPKPLRSDGIIFKRDSEKTAGEMLEEARFQRGLDNYELNRNQ